MPAKQRKSVRRRIRWSKASSFLNLLVFLLGIIGIVLIILFIHYPTPKEYPSNRFENYTFRDTIITINGENILESSRSEISSSPGSEEATSASVDDEVSEESIEEYHTSNRAVHKFYIIAGSFKNQANADILKRQLVSEGYASSVIKTKNNLFRVSIGEFINQDNANNAFDQIRKGKYKDVWILEVH
jgi:hypothetical protein